ncbi:MAG: M23 family metallopeptidase, partial [Desulfobacula sp.]
MSTIKTQYPMTDYHPGTGFHSDGRGWVPSENHKGKDFGTRTVPDLPIPSAADGVIVWSAFFKDYGNTVVIKHTGSDGTNFFTLYAHLDGDRMPAVGTEIQKGQVIGEAGGTGAPGGGSYPIHLHYEVREYDPGILELSNVFGNEKVFKYIPIDPGTFHNWPSTGVFSLLTDGWQTPGAMDRIMEYYREIYGTTSDVDDTLSLENQIRNIYN